MPNQLHNPFCKPVQTGNSFVLWSGTLHRTLTDAHFLATLTENNFMFSGRDFQRH